MPTLTGCLLNYTKDRMADIFRFKCFDVDQAGCAMRVNTDAALLGALTEGRHASKILDIGTGTGVVALMLAQRFPDTHVDGVEIDPLAAATAELNFRNSPFDERLSLTCGSFQDYLRQSPGKSYDLIVSNPPFFLDSLKNADSKKQTARHADATFFSELLELSFLHLSARGQICLILPLSTSALVEAEAKRIGLFLQSEITILSFPSSTPHRKIITLGTPETAVRREELAIYKAEKQYSDQYRELLKNFLTIF